MTASAARVSAYGAFLTAFAQRRACQAHHPLQSTIHHDRAGPEGVEQLVLANDPVPVAEQIGEQIEHPWLEAQLPPE